MSNSAFIPLPLPTALPARRRRSLLARATCAAVTIAAAAVAVGCASGPHGPYDAATERPRDPERARILTLRAADLADSRPQDAESLLREALAADIYHGPAHNNLGVLYLRRGMLYEAAGEFEWARRLMPGHPDPRLNLGLTLESAGRLEPAMAEYEAAIEAQPGYLPAVQAKARLIVRSGPRVGDREAVRAALDEIALRGETQAWRDWARLQLATMADSAR